MTTSAATKAQLLAQVAELEAQLAASAAQSDPRTASQVRLVGLLKAVKDITRQGGRVTACGILVNGTDWAPAQGAPSVKVDLPVDGFIATDNGADIASQLLETAATYEWVRVALSGYWAPYGQPQVNERGYHQAGAKQLRVQRMEILSAGPERFQTPQQQQSLPFSAGPTSEEVPF